MALSGDQQALLSLIVVRDKSPDEVSSVLGIDRVEVDGRIVSALEALAPGEPPIPPEVALSLVGKADPLERADAASLIHLDGDLSARADRIREELGRQFPRAVDRPRAPRRRESSARGQKAEESRLPDQPSTLPTPVGGTPPPRQSAPESTGKGMDPGQRRLLSIVVSAAGLVAIVVAVLLLLDGGGNEDSPGSDVRPTEARLVPVQGEGGTGSIEFGFAGTQFAANVTLKGLVPSRRGETYALWLDGPVGAFPFERGTAGAEGVVAGQSTINQAIICFIAADLFTDIKVSRVPEGRFREALRKAVSAGGGSGPFPDFVGETVLEGPISMPAETRETLVRECGGGSAPTGSQGS